jgi:peroxiredoxin Q/BCP
MNKQEHIYLTILIQNLRDKFCYATISNCALIRKMKNKNLVIYFYPQDNARNCVIEAKEFSKYYNEFQEYDTEIIGISKDGVSSHNNFKAQHKIPFELISDPSSVLHKVFKIPKRLFFLGAKRTTFLFNKQGLLINEWREIEVQNHTKKVLSMAKKVKNDEPLVFRNFETDYWLYLKDRNADDGYYIG